MPKWGLPLADGVVGEVGEVLCGVGDAVRRDEVVVVVETDKVSVDIRAARDGVVAAVLSAQGEEVSEGQPLLPGYVTMGENGMDEHGAHVEMGHMPVPENSIPMVGAAGPFGYITMGGMYTNLLVREKPVDYDRFPG